MSKWIAFFAALLLSLVLGSNWYYKEQIAQLPTVRLQSVNPQMLQGSKVLPFYELMSPIPVADGIQFLPKLEYVKGPPERYIERISLVFFDQTSAKERIYFYGRQTPTAGKLEWNTAAFFLQIVKWCADRNQAPQEWGFREKLYAVELANKWLKDASQVFVMEQAGQPAFLIEYTNSPASGEKSVMLFFRQNSLFRAEFFADKKMQHLRPKEIFQRSFLVRNRNDALEFSAKSLTSIKLDENQSKHYKLSELNWPMALLAVNLSLDPNSLDSYFHFAGINALLFKSSSMDGVDMELLDIIRNNIISASVYAKDIDSKSIKTKEISALSRQVLKSLEPQ